MASDPTVDFPEPKTLGDVLDRMPLIPDPQPGQITHVGLGIYQAISMIMADLGEVGISKDKTAKQGGSFAYRGIDQVYEALNKLLVKHGVVMLPRYRDRKVEERKSREGNALFNVSLVGEFEFVCISDGSRTTVTTYGEAFDSADKASSKAMSVSMKYAAFQLFCIPVEGENTEDIEERDHKVQPKDSTPQPQQPQESDEDRRKRLETEARNNYNDAEAWLRACTTVADLKRTFEESIRWDRIPKGWHPRLVAVEKEMLAQINAATAAPKRGSVAPSFGDIADDLPF